jgi:hypothetical protein
MAATTTGAHVWLTDYELLVLAQAVRLRGSSWRAERSQAQRAGDDQAATAATGVLDMLDHLAAKLDQAARRVAS